ncbi:MAG: alpha/beta hydrolase, partial [Planctomycetia bacterium]|nr:alpha/beta hydrolase [Planctomycetia bacterium]
LLAAEPQAPATKLEKNIPYYSADKMKNADDYMKQRCVLDLMYPTEKKGFATIVWFHGGGLVNGSKGMPPFKSLDAFNEGRLALVGCGYRLSPKVPYPVFLEDAAAAVAWVMKNIDRYGGDPSLVFVSGSSAGGWLTGMLGLDKRWLAAHGIDHHDLAGLLPYTGQMTSHFNVKKMLNVRGERYLPVIDENAPLAYLAKDVPPVFLFVGSRKTEIPGRTEENELMYASLKALGHPLVDFMEVPGIGHNVKSTLVTGATAELYKRIDQFIIKATELKKKSRAGK